MSSAELRCNTHVFMCEYIYQSKCGWCCTIYSNTCASLVPTEKKNNVPAVKKCVPDIQ